MSVDTLTPEDLTRILRYLDLPATDDLPSSPLAFLNDYLSILPPSLLQPFESITTPKERSSLPVVKARRVLYASREPPPAELRADRGRLRWPLLWERMGGTRIPPPSINVTEEERWVEREFLPGKENAQHVKKLGGFLRILEEEREIEDVIEAKRAERRLDRVGEEFDEESDEEEEEEAAPPPEVDMRPDAEIEAEQEEVRRMFEKRLIELFVDGVDKVDYTEVDFTEPPGGDPIASRDAEDAYFADEPSSGTPSAPVVSNAGTKPLAERVGDRLAEKEGDLSTQNGKGEYDY